MDRRGFLGRLLGSVAALSLAPEALLWKPVADPTLPLVMPGALLTLPQITMEFLRQLGTHIQGELSAGAMIGPDGMIDQIGIDFAAPVVVDEHGLDPHQLHAAVLLMARNLEKRNARRFGRFVMPPLASGYDACSLSDSRTGLAVRGVRGYDWERDQELLRFDVLCGAA